MAADALTTTANEHRTDAPKLIHLLRGDLDWIAMTCLEKDRNRRYETANGLATEIQRYLNNEPVVACPPSTAYRVKKFVRRNKGPALAAAMVLTALCAGIVGTGWGLVRAERARQREAQRADGEREAKRAALAATEAERKAKDTALEREAETQAVLDFVENKVFAAARPEGQDGGLGQDVMLRRAIEAALPFVDQGLTNQPLIEARLRMTVGWSFWCLGDAKIAVEQFQAARLLYTQHRGSNHPDTLRSMYNLALGYEDVGRHAESLKLHEETLVLQKEILGPDHPDTLHSMLSVAFRYATAKRYDAAIQLGQEVLDLRIKMLGPDHLDTLTSKMGLARSYGMAGRNAEAIHLLEEVLLHKAKFGPRHPNTLRSMRNLAWCYAKAGRETDALKLREEVLPLVQSSLGFDHSETLESMIALAASYAVACREAEEIKLREEALGIFKTKLGSTNAASLDNMERLLRLLTHSKDPMLRNPTRALDLTKELAEANPGDGALWHSLGVAHYRASNWKSAVDALHKSMELRKGGDAFGWLYLAMAQWQLGNKDEARRRYERVVGWMNKNDPASNGRTGEAKLFKSLIRLRSEAAELLGVNEKK
jgi:tetratricopeptide (TPR) repeat protein